MKTFGDCKKNLCEVGQNSRPQSFWSESWVKTNKQTHKNEDILYNTDLSTLHEYLLYIQVDLGQDSVMIGVASKL